MNKDELTAVLREAAAAHHDYESRVGYKDEDWAAWYAQWMTAKGYSLVRWPKSLSTASADAKAWMADMYAGSFEG